MLSCHLKYVAILLSVLVIAAPVSAENFEVMGTLTIKPDHCTELPNLAETAWSGAMAVVSGTGYHFGQAMAISIVSQEENLFTGFITRNDYYAPPQYWLPVPFYGAFIGCYQIRIATGETVLFAELNETADSASGYIFSTDPLGLEPDKQPSPNMAVFELTRDMLY